MSTEAIKAAMRRVVDEAWNHGDFRAIDEVYAPTIVRHQPPEADLIGTDAYKQAIADIRTAYPDWQITVDEIIAEGNAVAMRGVLLGTQMGTSPMFGTPATGKTVRIPYNIMAHFVDGRCVEEWAITDYLGALQQLGGLPRPVTATATV